MRSRSEYSANEDMARGRGIPEWQRPVRRARQPRPGWLTRIALGIGIGIG